MRPEAQCPADARYLLVDELYSTEALKTMQAACVRRFRTRPQDAAYRTFVEWVPRANEVAVFTWYAYADFAVPKEFDCVFRLADPREHVLVRYALTQSIWEGWWPMAGIEHGHQHVCVLRFGQEIPAVFGRLHQADGRFTCPPGGREQLGLCQARDLPAIAGRLEKVARLRAQYGARWREQGPGQRPSAQLPGYLGR